MSDQYALAGQGLKYVFIGAILCIFTFIPILGGILAVVGLILHLVGLHTAAKTHQGFQTAFTVAIVNLVISVLSIVLPFLSVITFILSLVECYYICTSASELLYGKGDSYQGDKGLKVWRLYRNCVIVTVVCTILAFVPILGLLAAIVAVIAAIVLLVASILYVIFLYKAQESLQM